MDYVLMINFFDSFEKLFEKVSTPPRSRIK